MQLRLKNIQGKYTRMKASCENGLHENPEMKVILHQIITASLLTRRIVEQLCGWGH